MLSFLCLSSVSKGIEFIAKDKIARSISELPTLCLKTNTFEVSQNSTKIELEAKRKVCVKSAGSIFINGKDIDIVGYTNLSEKISGKGVFANLGSSSYDNYLYVLESQTKQTISVINSIIIHSGLSLYVTTENSHDTINILKKHMIYNSYYAGSYLLLGPKTELSLTVRTGLSTFANVTSIDGRSILVGFYVQQTFTGSSSALMINAASMSSSDKCKVKLTSSGSNWETPMEGFVETKENYIYKDSDFESTSIPVGIVVAVVIIFCIVVIGVVLGILYCFGCFKPKKCCCCCKDNNEENEEDPGAEEGNGEYVQYSRQQEYRPYQSPQQGQPVYGVPVSSPYSQTYVPYYDQPSAQAEQSNRNATPQQRAKPAEQNADNVVQYPTASPY